MNAGIEAANGKYLLLLNNDAYLYDSNVLQRFVTSLANSADDVLGIFPTAVFAWDPQTINADFAIWHEDQMWYEPHAGESVQLSKQGQRVFGGLFISPIVKTKLWRELGGFSKEFFSYGEDFDVCYRAATMGLTFLHDPDLIVHHDHRSSSNEATNPLWSFYLFHRNYLLVVFRNYEFRHLFSKFGWYSRFFRSALYNSAKNLEITKIIALLRVFFSLILMLPYVIRSRNHIQKSRVMRDCDIWSTEFVLPFNPHYNYGSVQISVLSTIGHEENN